MANYQLGTPILINDTFYVSGVATDPSQIVYTLLAPDGSITTYTWPGAIEITHAGVGEFSLSLGALAIAGLYHYDVDATGTVVASRQGAFNVLADAQQEDVPWAVVGPCSTWASSQDVWECCGQPTEVIDGIECNVDFTSWAVMASQILFELSGRLYSGQCAKTVRPCRQDCGCGIQILSRGHIIGPWDWGGGWNWMGNSWGCDGNPCGCSPLSQVLLSGYPVREITEVKIDGDVVDPDTYRLDGFRWLVRVRDPADPATPLSWPSCQQLDLPDTEDGTFSVTYSYGQDPPIAGTRAAAALACQLYLACSQGAAECEIPSNAVRVTRQGVTIDRDAVMNFFFHKQDNGGGWKTGITSVDTFLNSLNPAGIQQRPRTWSPDGTKYARKVG